MIGDRDQKEADAVRDATLKRLLSTPPKPKAPVTKKKPKKR